MSTSAPEQGTSPSGVSGSRESAGERGRLVVADRLVEKIAAQCASEFSSVGGRGGGFLGMGGHADLDSRPNVKVELTGSIAVLSVELGIEYPLPLEETTEQVREALVRTVSRLAGVEVRQVDIRVRYLVPQHHQSERVLL
ncbi:Asp23/Gls24 family envelope stress response protein [uncultured Kocuria sp.]|uniref:Asp23/Gls24 family envelope stress response protein n=1 Tax=uncultured Kocuria sp. TaxID=259305 RepID=UPI002597E872|nr:Asp23/Gls24 family envelope stress response protein [uncultured Kocuria sp.]MCT1368005.1 Asp23/Gls24 family envelope stress response protein [Rothia sp. p3-SID1597]